MPKKDEPPKKRKKIVTEEVPETPSAPPSPAGPETLGSPKQNQEVPERANLETMKLETEVAEVSGQTVPTPKAQEPVATSPVEVQEPVTPSAEPRPNEPEPALEVSPRVESSPSFLTLLIITIGVALVVAIVVGAVYVYISGLNKIKSQPISSPSATPAVVAVTPTPVATSSAVPVATASATPKTDLSAFKLSVLNGSGKAGAAGKAKILLESAGFKVGNTGNAQSFDASSTTIQAKKGVDASVVAAAKAALAGTYTVNVGTALDTSSPYDLVITVGRE
jgi:hypothetical protein